MERCENFEMQLSRDEHSDIPLKTMFDRLCSDTVEEAKHLMVMYNCHPVCSLRHLTGLKSNSAPSHLSLASLELLL